MRAVTGDAKGGLKSGLLGFGLGGLGNAMAGVKGAQSAAGAVKGVKAATDMGAGAANMAGLTSSLGKAASMAGKINPSMMGGNQGSLARSAIGRQDSGFRRATSCSPTGARTASGPTTWAVGCSAA